MGHQYALTIKDGNELSPEEIEYIVRNWIGQDIRILDRTLSATWQVRIATDTDIEHKIKRWWDRCHQDQLPWHSNKGYVPGNLIHYIEVHPDHWMEETKHG